MEQVRATDLDHAAVVENLSRGKGISYQSLKSYKVLSEEDYKDPDSLWYEAPIVVTINCERFSLVCAAATWFAHSRGTIVLRWMSKHKDFEQRPPEEHMKDVYKDPCFYEYFVAGAECCLNASVNRDLGLVNALPFVMHSLTMPDKETHRELKDALANTEPGGVATISAPFSINVEVSTEFFTKQQAKVLRENRVFKPDSEEFPTVKRRRLSRYVHAANPSSDGSDSDASSDLEYSDSGDLSSHGSVPEVSEENEFEKIIIPFTQGGSVIRKKVQVPGVKGKFRPCRVSIEQLFPIDLNFVITVNRSQGQTLKKVILAVSERKAHYLNFSYAGLYVAFSRVKNKDDIRLLLCGRTEARKWSSVSYATVMRPGPSFFAVTGGFCKNGGDGWVDDGWDKNTCKRLMLFFKKRR
jgi:hypothetical protein